MKDFITSFIAAYGFFVLTAVTAVYIQLEYVDKNKPIEPIVINCPTGEKHIVIPDARKMEL